LSATIVLKNDNTTYLLKKENIWNIFYMSDHYTEQAFIFQELLEEKNFSSKKA